MSNTKSIAIVGVGGQGTVLTSDILIEGLVDLGFDVKKTEQHGLSQQGGSVNCMVKYGDAVYAPIIADGEADVVVAFEKIEALRWLKLLKAGGTLIVNDNEILPIPVKMGKASYPHDAIEQLQQTVEHVCPVRATELAQQLGTIRVASIILLGALVKKLGLEQYDWTGKTIIPFATSGGSGMGKTNQELAPSCPGALLKEGRVLSPYSSKQALEAWANAL